MRTWRSCSNGVAIGLMVVVAMPLGCGVAAARTHHRHHHYHHALGYHAFPHFRAAHFSSASRPWHRVYARRAVIQCVAFVKEESDIQLSGNAASWWEEADGLYDKGQVPEVGAILSFRGTGRIRLGHVAIVSRIVSAREIEVDQAHWASNGISRGVSVIDVSPDNDWTAVRVRLNGSTRYGSVYATDGFIYDRPPSAHVQLASTTERVPADAADQAGEKPFDQSGAQFAIDSSDLALTTGADEIAPAPHWRWHRHHHYVHHHWHRSLARRQAEPVQARGRQLKLSLNYLPLFRATW